MDIKHFFLNQSSHLFIHPYSIAHFIMLLLTLIILVIVYKKKDNINLNNSRFTLGFILIINWILRRGSFILYGVYSYKNHLDINFCNFTSILMMLYCITGNKKIFKLVYPMVFIGPLLSLVFPSVSISPLNYSFYSFIILHYVVFIYNFIFMMKEDINYSFKENIVYRLIIFGYFILTQIIDVIFNLDYNYPATFVNCRFSFLDNILKLNIVPFIIMIAISVLLSFVALFILKIVKKSIV